MLASSGATNYGDGETILAIKEWINQYSVPQLSLPFFFFPIFIFLLLFYKQWTRPKVALVLLILFCVVYFGSMLIDENYFIILAKPDNVPITMMLLGTGFCLWIALRQAAINDGRILAGQPLLEEDKDDKVLVWPDLVYTEMICIVLACAALAIWSILIRAPLESPANPAGPPNPSKAPWYFLGLQEMLVYFDPWMAGVVLPTMILTGLIAMPYCDTNPRGNGYYTFRERKFIITSWLFGFIILWMVLIVFGTFLRGPNWNFFGPYEYWDATKQVPLTNVNVSDYFWLFLLKMPLPDHPILRESIGILFTIFWMFFLPIILGRTILRRMLDQLGSWRFYIMAIHLVVMGLLPLKMVFRWLLNLKYFVYLPEFNLNL